MVLGTTNRIGIVDEAFKRRFLMVEVELPDREARLKILKMNIPPKLFTTFQLASLAELTKTFSGDDLKDLCERAQQEAFACAFEKVDSCVDYGKMVGLVAPKRLKKPSFEHYKQVIGNIIKERIAKSDSQPEFISHVQSFPLPAITKSAALASSSSSPSPMNIRSSLKKPRKTPSKKFSKRIKNCRFKRKVQLKIQGKIRKSFKKKLLGLAGKIQKDDQKLLRKALLGSDESN